MKPTICIITGPCGAGKSIISKSLAKEIKRSAYLEVDLIRNDMILNGFVSPVSYKGESKKQVDLATKNASALALNFYKAGFNVFIDDVLEKKQQVKDYSNYLKKFNLQIFLLLPNKRILSKRDKCRTKENQMGKRAIELHDIFTERISEENWHVLDTSGQSIQDTHNEILKILGSG